MSQESEPVVVPAVPEPDLTGADGGTLEDLGVIPSTEPPSPTPPPPPSTGFEVAPAPDPVPEPAAPAPEG